MRSLARTSVYPKSLVLNFVANVNSGRGAAEDEPSSAQFVARWRELRASRAPSWMVELALTRIFSVTMYYHFAFLPSRSRFSD